MGEDSEVTRRRVRRRGKELRERLLAAVVLIPVAPLISLCALVIKLEGLVDPNARGPVFFHEDRVSRGRIIKLIKFRTLTSRALDALGPGPTHIATLEKSGHLTRAGRLIRQWYLDELPQIWNIVRGDMFLIGTRPFPIELYEEELAQGITRKRDMPAGLIGPVQASKGTPALADSVRIDAEYWEAFQTYPWWKLLALDARIVRDSLKVQLRHQGI